MENKEKKDRIAPGLIEGLRDLYYNGVAVHLFLTGKLLESCFINFLKTLLADASCGFKRLFTD
jgi:hypothetical protein